MIKAFAKSMLSSMGYELWKTSGPFYYQDGLSTGHNSSFMKSPRFISAYSRAKSLAHGQDAYQGPWRAHTAMWEAETALRAPEGDFVECGVWLGFVSSMIMTYTDWNVARQNRRFFLVDSYEGLADELITHEESAKGTYLRFRDKYKGTLPRARETMRQFSEVHFVQGYVPDILPSIDVKDVAFLHLDMNSAVAEAAALSFFWPKLVAGGVALFDDYAFEGYEPQKAALDEVAEKFGASILSLPTGQGLLIKSS
jgi:hypothetical protein